MSHTLQERWSSLVLAKLRKLLVLKDGVVFNNNYEGDPKAGAVKIPVRDTEVAVSDYDRANGIKPTNGSTTYETMVITHDVAVNEIIDGYEASAVPDNLVADRLDSAAYAMAHKVDDEGATVLLAAATHENVDAVTVENAYEKLVDIRTAMSKANIPTTGRYCLATPDFYALILKDKEHFVGPTGMGAEIVATGAVGQIAGFTVYEWNDSTAGLQCVCGHPDFATRCLEFSVPVRLQDLSGSGNYIGSSAVQGRSVFDHKVLRSVGIRAMFAPAALAVTAAPASTAGKTVLTVTGASGSLQYKVKPAARAAFGETYSGTALTSGSTSIAVNPGETIEVVDLASGAVAAVGYITVSAADIK